MAASAADGADVAGLVPHPATTINKNNSPLMIQTSEALLLFLNQSPVSESTYSVRYGTDGTNTNSQ